MHKLYATLWAWALVAVDQWLKWWAASNLPQGDLQPVPDVLHLTYRENYGAAFSILQGRVVFLVVLTSVVLAGALFLVYSGRIQSTFLLYTTMTAFAGGVGNLLDRIFRGYVVDYIYFVPINFPVFNFADCCVVVGMVLICVYIFFFEERRHAKG